MNVAKNVPLRMHIFTPPFCTNFPHLTVDASILSKQETTVETLKRETKYIDLSMYGAGPVQKEFRQFMDELDDTLLQYVFENQRLVGKHGESLVSLRCLQRRMFRPRISAKTGRKYEDSMLAKCKAFAFKSGRPVIQTASENMIPVYNDKNERIAPTEILFHDMVVCSLRYDGCYAKPAIGFGHQWVLLGVKTYGHVLEASVVYDDDKDSEATVRCDENGKEIGPEFLFPEITNPEDFPRDATH